MNVNSRFSISLDNVTLSFIYDSLLFFRWNIGVSSSEGTIQCWELTSHVVAKIKSDMEERVGLKKDVAKPKELQQGRIAFDEEAVKKCYNLLDTWPSMFITSECLISLSSGINAQEDVQKDLLRAEQVGKLQAERFIEERIKSNDVGFYETIKKNKLKTFTSLLATEEVAVKDKEVVIRADCDLFARLLVIREKREVSMKDFLRYSLGPVAWSLATPIGNVYKFTKSDLLTCLEKKINLVNQIPADAARVYDGMCIIRQLPTGFDTFGDLSDYVLKKITSNS